MKRHEESVSRFGAIRAGGTGVGTTQHNIHSEWLRGYVRLDSCSPTQRNACGGIGGWVELPAPRNVVAPSCRGDSHAAEAGDPFGFLTAWNPHPLEAVARIEGRKVAHGRGVYTCSGSGGRIRLMGTQRMQTTPIHARMRRFVLTESEVQVCQNV
jgi:hypothetical protein